MSRARTAFRLQAIAAAEAQLSDAQANLQRVIAASNQTATAAAARATPTPTATPVPTALPSVTSVTAADVAAAQTALQQAQAQLQTLTAKPAPAHIGALQAAVSAAQQSYATVAQTDSTAQTSAEQQLAKVTNDVHTAQTAYNTALFQNQQAQLGIDPQTSQRFGGTAAATDSAKQHYAALFATANDQLKAVQAQLAQATAASDAATHQERSDLAIAQTRVDQAQQLLAAAIQPPDPAALATAQAQVTTAQTQLTTFQVALAAANAAQAQAKALAQKQLADAQKNAAKLATPTASPAVAAAQLAVTQAQTQLTLARQGAVGSKGWMWPTFGTITSGFGLRDMAVGHFHNGVDIANPQGTPIGAARDGVVIEAGWCSGYGYCVKLQHTAGFESEYGHLAGPPPVKVGQVVSVGTIIGAMGTTYDEAGGGFSTGVHLHFTIRSYGVAVDPLRYLP
ncbi:MAG: M23 family metallopeptidase [Herpetosiphonaceae bacterium]|nr:M23 family metallopeptidase [Herpetosiphonaceae bacterium]